MKRARYDDDLYFRIINIPVIIGPLKLEIV